MNKSLYCVIGLWNYPLVQSNQQSCFLCPYRSQTNHWLGFFDTFSEKTMHLQDNNFQTIT